MINTEAELVQHIVEHCTSGKLFGRPSALTKARADVALLRAALVGLIGESEPDKLRNMEAAVRMMPRCDEDKAAALNAIHALIKTASA